jgi:hypothetical protein
VTFNVFDIVKLGRKWVVHVNDNDLPVRLVLIQQGHDTEHLDLLDVSWLCDKFANLADVKWVIIALGLSLGVDDVGVFPGLRTV